MKKKLLVSLCLLPLYAHAEVVSESFCFSGGNQRFINFELRTYFDTVAKWSGAFVKYSKSNIPISLVLKDVRSEEIDSQSPEQTTNTWLEISDGKITGEYEMMTQGGNVLSMRYVKINNGKEFFFENNLSVKSSLESGCSW
ncbi:hypothetical protein [Pseudomonas fluorescens]|uniref:hypothetical protein n=1 Tax=Pseudomonas fluorescens TaxID=294 RepID=UPI001241ECC2|nr:hypothetical protein [Pseudomonas fluorescens]